MLKNPSIRLSHTPQDIIRCPVPSTFEAAGMTRATDPRRKNSPAQATAIIRLVNTPAVETIRSPRT